MTIPELIERLQNAEGPSRELDALIWCVEHPECKYIGSYEAYGEREKTQVEFTLPPKRKSLVTANRGQYNHADNTTASIDAAIAFKDRVLPETAVDHIGADAVSSPNGYKTIGWTVELINGRRFQGQHQLLPIALVIATLRALAEHEEAGR